MKTFTDPDGFIIKPVEKMTPAEYVFAARKGSNPIGAASKDFWDKVQSAVIILRKRDPLLDYSYVRNKVALAEAAKCIARHKKWNNKWNNL